MSESLDPWTAALQASLSLPSLGACSNSCPLSCWFHPTISSSVVPFSSCLHSFPASGSFLMSQLFASGGQENNIWHFLHFFPIYLPWCSCEKNVIFNQCMMLMMCNQENLTDLIWNEREEKNKSFIVYYHFFFTQHLHLSVNELFKHLYQKICVLPKLVS